MEGERGEKIPEKTERIRERIEGEQKDSTKLQDFVAVLDGEVIGYSIANINAEDRHYIGALYVLPRVQGIGAGHLLLERTLNWHGTDNDIYLNVASYNEHAKRFYERHGFNPSGKEFIDESVAIDGVAMPELEMIRRATAENYAARASSK
jgi:GNAT superfamily N-acetyltransferase